nr:hypothetical protein [Streptomyces fragilis]
MCIRDSGCTCRPSWTRSSATRSPTWKPRSVSYTHLDVYKRQRLYLPTIMDPVFGYQVTNVEASICLLYTSRCV